jgi:heme/copper-type cytochrome/quinol oxidase subunit 1
MYLSLGVFSGLIGLMLSDMIRIELSASGLHVFSVIQDYNVIISAHGVLMIFFFIMPLVISSYGNVFIPILTNSFDLALLRLNLCGFWLIFNSLVFIVLCSVICEGPGIG